MMANSQLQASRDELLRQWDSWVFGVDDALTDPHGFDWSNLQGIYGQLLGHLGRLSTAESGDGALSPALLCRMEWRLDMAVASLEALMVAFRCEPNAGVEWAITSCVVLLQYALQLRNNSSQTDRTGPAAAYASLLRLCLVDCPALLAAVPLWATSPNLSSFPHHVGDWGAGSSGDLFLRRSLALCRVVLDRLAQAGYLGDLLPLTTAADWVLSCYKLVAFCGSMHILGEETCQQALSSIMRAANQLLKAAADGAVGVTESVWGVFARDLSCLSLHARFLLTEAAKQDAIADLACTTIPSAWEVVALLLQLPDAYKAVYPCFVKTLLHHSAARDSWTAFLEQLGTLMCASCSGTSTIGAVSNKQARRGLSLTLISLWEGCSLLHGSLLHDLKGPHAVDPLAAQWAEQLGMAAAERCLGIMEGAAGWDDEAWRDRGRLLRSCASAYEDYLSGISWSCQDVMWPALAMFTSASRAGQASARIPGRQAVAAVTSAAALAEHTLRLAGRIPLWYWAEDHSVDDIAGTFPNDQLQPWFLCSTAAVLAGRWLEQRLPARRGGPIPVMLVSVLETGAAPGFFKSLLSIIATQRKVVRKWAGALSGDPVAEGEERHTVRFLLNLARLVTHTSQAALALAPRPSDPQQGHFTSRRCLESLAAVALGAMHTLKPLLAPYEHWAWQQGSRTWPKPFYAALAGVLMHAWSRSSTTKGGAQALLLGAAPLLQGPGKLGQGAAELVRDQASWMAGFCNVTNIKLDGQHHPGLLLAAIQGGLLRSLAGWAQHTCQQIEKGEAEVAASMLKVLDLLFAQCCQELDARVGGQSCRHRNNRLLNTYNLGQTGDMDRMTHRQLAGLRTALSAAWEVRSRELVPQMESAAAWGTRYLVVWSSGGGNSSSGQSSSVCGEGIGGKGNSSGGEASGSGDGGTVSPPGSPPSLAAHSTAEDAAVAAVSLQPSVTGQRASPGAASPTVQTGLTGCTADGACLSPTTVAPGGRDQQQGGLAQQQPAEGQQQPWFFHESAVSPHVCPLGQVQRELALGGLVCAHAACPNFSGHTEAALPLQRCAGCRVASYCSPSCAKDDWSRHRAACNAFRRMRRRQASVQPAWNLRRQQRKGREHCV